MTVLLYNVVLHENWKKYSAGNHTEMKNNTNDDIDIVQIIISD